MRNKWLQERLKDLGGDKSQAGLARALGLPKTRVTDILHGTRRVTADEAHVIAQYIGWPLTRVRRMLSRDDNSDLPQPITRFRIPVVGIVKAGFWQEAQPYDFDDMEIIEAPGDDRYPGLQRYALRVDGPSMNLLYPHGSILIYVHAMDLGEGWRPSAKQRVIVQRTDDLGKVETTVKEFSIDATGQPWLIPRSTEPAFEAWKVPEFWEGDGAFEEHSDNLRVTGLVTQAILNEP